MHTSILKMLWDASELVFQLTSISKFACFYNPFLSLTRSICWGLWGFFVNPEKPLTWLEQRSLGVLCKVFWNNTLISLQNCLWLSWSGEVKTNWFFFSFPFFPANNLSRSMMVWADEGRDYWTAMKAWMLKTFIIWFLEQRIQYLFLFYEERYTVLGSEASVSNFITA